MVFIIQRMFGETWSDFLKSDRNTAPFLVVKDNYENLYIVTEDEENYLFVDHALSEEFVKRYL